MEYNGENLEEKAWYKKIIGESSDLDEVNNRLLWELQNKRDSVAQMTKLLKEEGYY